MSFAEFVRLGAAHIGALASEWIGPSGWHLPDGIDHIVFLLALVLGGGGLLDLLKTATGFTIGHSVTLALTALGLIHVPPWIAESAIALTIIVTASSAFLRNLSFAGGGAVPGRWKIAAVFGLIHGVGFAAGLARLSVPRERILPALLGFNIGVELGQLVILVSILPLVSALRSSRAVEKVGVSVALLAIFSAGSYWFASRLGA